MTPVTGLIALLLGGAIITSNPVSAATSLLTDQSLNSVMPTAASADFERTWQIAQKRAGGGAKAGARRAAPAQKRAPAAAPQRTPASNNANAARKDVDVNVNRNAGGPYRDVNVNVNKNVNVDRNARVVRRPGGWRGAHWGAVVAGVTLGTIIVVAANTAPPPPDPSLCWTWTNEALTEGYWYYCDGT
jgi:hypothetical protein